MMAAITRKDNIMYCIFFNRKRQASNRMHSPRTPRSEDWGIYTQSYADDGVVNHNLPEFRGFSFQHQNVKFGGISVYSSVTEADAAVSVFNRHYPTWEAKVFKISKTASEPLVFTMHVDSRHYVNDDPTFRECQHYVRQVYPPNTEQVGDARDYTDRVWRNRSRSFNKIRECLILLVSNYGANEQGFETAYKDYMELASKHERLEREAKEREEAERLKRVAVPPRPEGTHPHHWLQPEDTQFRRCEGGAYVKFAGSTILRFDANMIELRWNPKERHGDTDLRKRAVAQMNRAAKQLDLDYAVVVKKGVMYVNFRGEKIRMTVNNSEWPETARVKLHRDVEAHQKERRAIKASAVRHERDLKRERKEQRAEKARLRAKRNRDAKKAAARLASRTSSDTGDRMQEAGIRARDRIIALNANREPYTVGELQGMTDAEFRDALGEENHVEPELAPAVPPYRNWRGVPVNTHYWMERAEQGDG